MGWPLGLGNEHLQVLPFYESIIGIFGTLRIPILCADQPHPVTEEKLTFSGKRIHIPLKTKLGGELGCSFLPRYVVIHPQVDFFESFQTRKQFDRQRMRPVG